MCKQISKDKVYECSGTCGANAVIWGTGTYTGDSNVYVAAKHAGLVPGRFIKIDKGTTKNGVESKNYAFFATSYILVKQSEHHEQALIAIQAFKEQFVMQIERLKEQVLSGVTSHNTKLVCSVCMQSSRTNMCIPCNHVNYCEVCIKKVVAIGNCAVCNQQVTGYMRVYL